MRSLRFLVAGFAVSCVLSLSAMAQDISMALQVNTRFKVAQHQGSVSPASDCLKKVEEVVVKYLGTEVFARKYRIDEKRVNRSFIRIVTLNRPVNGVSGSTEEIYVVTLGLLLTDKEMRIFSDQVQPELAKIDELGAVTQWDHQNL